MKKRIESLDDFIIESNNISLEHPSTMVVVNNKEELEDVLKYAEKIGKNVSDFMWKVDKFPYALGLSGKIVGWQDDMSRNFTQMSYNEFKKVKK
jgi:hypothetical protein